MTSIERIFHAYLDELNIITILVPMSYQHDKTLTFFILDGIESKPLKILSQTQIDLNVKYVCELEGPFSFGKSYWIADDYGGKTDLQIGAVIRTVPFDDIFYYDGNDLGVQINASETCFKLWAPTATQVKVKLRAQQNHFSEIFKMKREDYGVWSLLIKQDLELCQYTYLVLVNQEWHEAVDPYTRAVSADGEHGIIVKRGPKTRRKPQLPPIENPVNAIIYETHIRDFTIHKESGIKNKGLYLGMAEQNTKGTDGNITGVSYLKDLGITHVQIMPFHEFAGVNKLHKDETYNWGYNPTHFNVPEGSYATDPANPYSRMTELKEMIKEIHQCGLRVIMDVVYNHVYIRESSSFEKLVPGYYFRHNEFGIPSNGTGVGNDIASERKMVRKFILDSISYWLHEFQVDGFRFDLMGILDIETMNAVRKICDGVSKDILLIGEGWNLNTPLPLEQKAIIKNQDKIPQIGQFNDRFRDSIKGSTFNLFDKGYSLGNDHYLETACESITGSIGFTKKENRLFNQPFQSVNYIECHDNHTLWDKLCSCFGDASDSVKMKYHRLATGLVILSQGIPFLHSGQEFFRTKNGDGNSYRSPDSINQIDWERKSQYMDNVNYVKGLIQIRKMFSCFRLQSSEEIFSQVTLLPLPSPLLGLLYQNKNNDYRQVMLLVNPLNKELVVSVPEGNWAVFANDESVGISPNRAESGGEVNIGAICLNIWAKK